MKPHKHKDLIIAWANGAEVEYRQTGTEQDWMPFDGRWTNTSTWEYRIKPQPKEPQYLYVYSTENGIELGTVGMAHKVNKLKNLTEYISDF